MNTIFHLNWMRETATGYLEADLGTQVCAHDLELAIMGLLPAQQPDRARYPLEFLDVASPSRLPEWARQRVEHFFGGEPKKASLTMIEGFCNRIRDTAWNLEEAGLFLPYFSRRAWIGRFSVFPEIGFDRSADGVVAKGVNPHSLHEIALRTAAGVFTRTQPVSPIHFSCSTPLMAPWRILLLERYGIDLCSNRSPIAKLTIDAPGTLLSSWQDTPRERQCYYYSVFSRLALAVQNSLRRWTLSTFALGLDDLADFDSGGDVLVYAATRPHAEKQAHDFSYDVLDAELMEFAFTRASRRLEPLLRTAHDQLMAAGRDDEARQYVRRDVRLHAPKVSQRARRRSRVRSMLVAEGVLIYSLIKFAGRLKSLDSAKAVTMAADDLAKDFSERIRKLFFFMPNPEEFGTMLFLEASHAIHSAMGGEQTLEVSCSTADGLVHRSVRPMSESLMPI